MDADKTKLFELGKKIRELRTSLGMTQFEFSAKTEVNKKAYRSKNIPDIIEQGIPMSFGHPFNSWNFSIEE